MFEWLYEFVTQSPQAYLLVFAIAATDAVFPAVPSETLLILGGVQAAQGELSLWWLIAAGAVGAFLGDNTSYWIGRTGGRPLVRKLEKRKRFVGKLDWARARLRAGGGYTVAVARFVPGGRTAVTFSAGALRMGWPQFLLLSALGATGWALYSALVGYLGGRAFAHSEWQALLLAFGIALAVTAAIEGARRLRGAG